MNTYVTLRGTASEPIRGITEIRIRDLGGTATGMVGLLLCHIIISDYNACTKFDTTIDTNFISWLISTDLAKF